MRVRCNEAWEDAEAQQGRWEGIRENVQGCTRFRKDVQRCKGMHTSVREVKEDSGRVQECAQGYEEDLRVGKGV